MGQRVAEHVRVDVIHARLAASPVEHRLDAGVGQRALASRTEPQRREGGLRVEAADAEVAGQGEAGFGADRDVPRPSALAPTLLAVWHMTKAQAGYIATGALITSAVGGWAAGVLADRYGRVRVLQWTVAWFAVFTALSGFTHSYHALYFTRALQGLGFGGEWAVGSVLIAETIAARHRGKASGLVQSRAARN